jgi:hypothetical protein
VKHPIIIGHVVSIDAPLFLLLLLCGMRSAHLWLCCMQSFLHYINRAFVHVIYWLVVVPYTYHLVTPLFLTWLSLSSLTPLRCVCIDSRCRLNAGFQADVRAHWAGCLDYSVIIVSRLVKSRGSLHFVQEGWRRCWFECRLIQRGVFFTQGWKVEQNLCGGKVVRAKERRLTGLLSEAIVTKNI